MHSCLISGHPLCFQLSVEKGLQCQRWVSPDLTSYTVTEISAIVIDWHCWNKCKVQLLASTEAVPLNPILTTERINRKR